MASTAAQNSFKVPPVARLISATSGANFYILDKNRAIHVLNIL